MARQWLQSSSQLCWTVLCRILLNTELQRHLKHNLRCLRCLSAPPRLNESKPYRLNKDNGTSSVVDVKKTCGQTSLLCPFLKNKKRRVGDFYFLLTWQYGLSSPQWNKNNKLVSQTKHSHTAARCLQGLRHQHVRHRPFSAEFKEITAATSPLSEVADSSPFSVDILKNIRIKIQSWEDGGKTLFCLTLKRFISLARVSNVGQ